MHATCTTQPPQCQPTRRHKDMQHTSVLLHVQGRQKTTTQLPQTASTTGPPGNSMIQTARSATETQQGSLCNGKSMTFTTYPTCPNRHPAAAAAAYCLPHAYCCRHCRPNPPPLPAPPSPSPVPAAPASSQIHHQFCLTALAATAAAGAGHCCHCCCCPSRHGPHADQTLLPPARWLVCRLTSLLSRRCLAGR